jgi:hypothetical protein
MEFPCFFWILLHEIVRRCFFRQVLLIGQSLRPIGTPFLRRASEISSSKRSKQALELAAEPPTSTLCRGIEGMANDVALTELPRQAAIGIGRGMS